MEEVWKAIEGYEGLYEVSNLGRVRGLKTKTIRKSRKAYGYRRINLCKNGVVTHHQVHRLVAQAFIPNPDNLPYVNHKNEVKDDNRAENLEWCDAKYNTNYGTARERMIRSQIASGYMNPNMIGLGDKEYHHQYYLNHKDIWHRKRQVS